MSKREETILGISPAGLRLATVRGKHITRLERVMLDPAENEANWSNELRPLDEPLANLCRELKLARGSRATIIYHAPTVACELVSVSASASAAAAMQAAVLSLREGLAGEASEWLTACRVIHTDPPESGEPAKTHALAVADRRSTSETIAAFAERAGLIVRKQIPAKAALLGAAVNEVLQGAAGDKMTVVAMSDQVTIISSAQKRSLIFARSVDFGYAQLLEAIMRGSGAGGTEGTIEREAACRVLFSVGIPKRGQILDSLTGLKSEAVLPGMQSAIQRYVVETRQTLRFMLAEGELARASIHLSGPGAMIPGIAGVLTGQLDLPIERIDNRADPEGPTVGAEDQRGDLATLAEGDEHLMAIAPPSASRRRDRKRRSAALCLGAAAAALVIAGDVVLNLNAAASLSTTHAVLAPKVEEMSARQRRIAEAATVAATVAAAEDVVLGAIGNRPDWLASLGALTRLAGDSIRLVDVNGSFPPEAGFRPVLVLKGIATPVGGVPVSGTSGDPLAQYIERLSKYPLVRSAQLVSTRSEESDDVKNFVVAVTLRSLPPAIPANARHAGAASGPRENR